MIDLRQPAGQGLKRILNGCVGYVLNCEHAGLIVELLRDVLADALERERCVAVSPTDGDDDLCPRAAFVLFRLTSLGLGYCSESILRAAAHSLKRSSSPTLRRTPNGWTVAGRMMVLWAMACHSTAP